MSKFVIDDLLSKAEYMFTLVIRMVFNSEIYLT